MCETSEAAIWLPSKLVLKNTQKLLIRFSMNRYHNTSQLHCVYYISHAKRTSTIRGFGLFIAFIQTLGLTLKKSRRSRLLFLLRR